MRKLALSFIALIALCGTALAQTPPVFGCNKIFQVNQGAVALTKILTGVAGQHFEICGYTISAGAAASTTSLSYGTGTNCGTGTTTLLPVINVAINSNVVDHTSVPHIAVPAVNASAVPIDVCLVTTGAGPTSVILYYAQF